MCQNRIRAGFLHLRTTLKLTVLSLNNKKAIFFAAAGVMVVLTLLEPGGGHIVPPLSCLTITVQLRVRAC